MQQTSDGGYILGGQSNSGISGDKSQALKGEVDYWVVKLDANGNKQWDKTIGGSGPDYFASLQQTSDGGYILGGTSLSFISGDKSQDCKGVSDYWVVKLDASGNKIWDTTLGGISYEDLTSLQQTSDGGYILGGYSQNGINGDKTQPSKGYYDYWVIKLNANGSKAWDKSIGGSGDDRLFNLQQTSDGGFILGGTSSSGISGDKTEPGKGPGLPVRTDDYWVVKLDFNGNKIWDKTIGSGDSDAFGVVRQTLDGGFILAGSSGAGIKGDKTQVGKGGGDFWIIKLDSVGNKIWDSAIGGKGGEFLYDLQQTSDGGYILGGNSSSGIGGYKSQPAFGISQWPVDDYWVVKLTGKLFPPAIDPVDPVEVIPEAYLFKQNQPNPFSESTTFSFSLPQPEEVEMEISNSLGQVVGKIREKYEAGNHQIEWREVVPNGNSKEGIYSCRLTAGTFQDIKRLVKL